MKNQKLVYSFSFVIVLFCMIQIFSYATYSNVDDTHHTEEFQKNYKIFSLNIPEDLAFAGEDVPIQDFEVREKLDRELLVNTYWQSQSILFLKRSNRWFSIIEPILKENGIPDDFKYLAVIESGLTNVISPSGATGFWQLMKPTAEEYGLEVTKEIDERYHVEKSTKAACKYLKKAYKRFGSWTLAAASYNMGMNGLSKQIKKQKVNSYYDLLLNSETARYLYRIIAVKEILSQPESYGFNVRDKDKYVVIPTHNIEIDSAVTNFADFALAHKMSYKTLKTFNPWMRQNFLKNIKNKIYIIQIPNDTTLLHSIQKELLPDSLFAEEKDSSSTPFLSPDTLQYPISVQE